MEARWLGGLLSSRVCGGSLAMERRRKGPGCRHRMSQRRNARYVVRFVRDTARLKRSAKRQPQSCCVSYVPSCRLCMPFCHVLPSLLLVPVPSEKRGVRLDIPGLLFYLLRCVCTYRAFIPYPCLSTDSRVYQSIRLLMCILTGNIHTHQRETTRLWSRST